MGIPDEDQHPHATGSAAPTVEAHRRENELVFHGSWFCPFVQRAWIVLQEKALDYQYTEVNPYKKEPAYLKVNPKGLVPALTHRGRNLYESQVIMEYLEDISDSKTSLLPSDPMDRAYARLWANHAAQKICPTFFRIILAQEKEKQKEAEKELLTALEEFVKAMDTDGPFFFGTFFSLTDIMLIPWLLRQPVILKEYKDFEIPSSGSPVWDRWSKWLEACKERKSVVETTSEPEQYRKTLERYANNTTQSEAAKATRAGRVFT